MDIVDRAVARYLDREARDALAMANACATVAVLARRARCGHVASALSEFGRDFERVAATLAGARALDVRWPERDPLDVMPEELAEALEMIDAELHHSARAQQWVAQRPDLPSYVSAMFASMATAQRLRRALLNVCRAVDGIDRDFNVAEAS